MPRDASRGDAVKRAVFCGCKHQLLPALRTPLFAEQLGKLGVSFDVVHKGLEGSLARDWYVSLQKWR